MMSKKFTLLVIEDDEASYRLIEAALRVIDLEMLHADNGQDGINLFSEHNVDLVLLDIQLPGMDGYEVLDHLKKINPKIQVIAQTAYSMSDDKDKCIELGCSDFLSKPLNIMQFRELIAEYKERLIP
ncbi:MAG: response regulator [Bacteroidota bacterium]